MMQFRALANTITKKHECLLALITGLWHHRFMTQSHEFTTLLAQCPSDLLAQFILDYCDEVLARTGDVDAAIATYSVVYDVIHRHLDDDQIELLDEAIDEYIDAGTYIFCHPLAR